MCPQVKQQHAHSKIVLDVDLLPLRFKKLARPNVLLVLCIGAALAEFVIAMVGVLVLLWGRAGARIKRGGT